MTTKITHPREAICPRWCDGHAGNYQAWESFTGGGMIRDHSHEWPGIRSDWRGPNTVKPWWATEVSVGLVAEEDASHHLSEIAVGVYVGNDFTRLSVTQARRLAGLLLDVCDEADADPWPTALDRATFEETSYFRALSPERRDEVTAMLDAAETSLTGSGGCTVTLRLPNGPRVMFP